MASVEGLTLKVADLGSAEGEVWLAAVGVRIGVASGGAEVAGIAAGRLVKLGISKAD